MEKKLVSEPFIYFEPLKTWEIVCMLLYATATLGVIFALIFCEPESKPYIIIAYATPSQLGMYFGLYTSLRNFKSYLIWFGFGLTHLILFLIFGSDPGNAATVLMNTIILLLLFQLLRYLSLKIQHREFVAPGKGGGSDFFEDKKATVTDFIIFVIYMASWFGLAILAFKMSFCKPL